jgi:hypothetical protein
LLVEGQNLPSKILDQPDGLTVFYFNSKVESCLPQIFIGNDLQILFPCYSERNYERVDISTATSEIKRLREILTRYFILKLNQCCVDKKCPDTIHGYFLMIKEGDKYDFQYLDIKFANDDKCGSKEMNEIIELLNKINKDYR